MDLLSLFWIFCAFTIFVSSQPSAEATLTGPRTVVENAQRTYEANTKTLLASSNSHCTMEKAGIRRAWDDLSDAERQDYINAVKCLNSKLARTPKELAPGARNWRDDFVYAHINQTNFNHISGLFLPWHRQFIWAYEQTLRNDCHYQGYLPYWPWERHSRNQAGSPVFQPTKTSFGGNGKYIPHGVTTDHLVGVPTPLTLYRQPGNGGGCVNSGAFENVPINLGPVGTVKNSHANRFGTHYNPRCLRRDFDQNVSSKNLTYKAIAELFQTESIHEFHPALEFGVHPNSHIYIGGSGYDLYSSPNDPVFFLLHAQIDRIWTIWQSQDYETRTDALDGTVTIGNDPPSQNATLSTIMKMGVPAGGDLPISHAMSAVGNDYCYMYA